MTTASAGPAAPPRRRVLVAEDEFFIADHLTQSLRSHGMEVIGPVADRTAAVLLAKTAPLDAAVLDILLNGEDSLKVADILKDRRIPFLFASGYSQNTLPDVWRSVPHWEKPFDADALARAVLDLTKSTATDEASC